MKIQKKVIEEALNQQRKDTSRLLALNEKLSNDVQDMQESFNKRIEAHSIVNHDLFAKNTELDVECNVLREELMKIKNKPCLIKDVKQPQKQCYVLKESPVEGGNFDSLAEEDGQNQIFNVECLKDEVQLIRSQLNSVKRKSCEQDQKLLGLREKLLVREQESRDKDTEICQLQKDLQCLGVVKETNSLPYSPKVQQHCSHHNTPKVSQAIYARGVPLNQEHFHRQTPVTYTVPDAMLLSQQMSAGNQMIISTFQEGHSIIQDIFKEKDRLQHEIEEARQARQRK